MAYTQTDLDDLRQQIMCGSERQAFGNIIIRRSPDYQGIKPTDMFDEEMVDQI